MLSHPKQLLKQHLFGVADIAVKTHLSHGIKPELERIIYIISLCHDFAKSTRYFQRYIIGEKINEHLKAHGLLSAVFTYWLLPEEYKVIGFLVVKSHHGDIKNVKDELEYDEFNWNFEKQLKSLDEDSVAELNSIYQYVLNGRTIEDFIEFAQDIDNLMDIWDDFQFSKKSRSHKDIILCQYIYSLLLTADKSQLILGDAFIPKEPFDENIVFQYKEELVKQSLVKKPELIDSDIFKFRNMIYEEMMENLKKVDLKETKIFSINVPTGAGKTILSYQASFYIANKLKELNKNISPSIIYTLPFTSVIDQNHDVLLDILHKFYEGDISDEDILKFHSVTPIKYKDFDGYDARFCFENWQSRIISTTFVQLFNTIFKLGDNSVANRFHKLANSVVILDEVQNIDTKYFKIIEEFLNYISKEYNVYFILVTATMPLLLKPYNLIPNAANYFRQLNRICIENYSDTPITLTNFKNIVLSDINNNSDKSFLIILNTIKSSLDVFEFIKKNTNRNVLYLSTEIYPKLRLAIIENIKRSKEKYIVVSTPLVEAGVDIDMDFVYRDFSPLDSINQSAGRCNRNGLNFKGILKLYKVIDDNSNFYHNYIYPRPLVEATESILSGKKVIEEKDFFDLNNLYFKEVDLRKVDSYSNKLLKFADNFNFENFRKEFNLIEKNELIKTDVVVNIDSNSDSILKKIQNNNGDISQLDLKNLFRELRQYTASVPTKDIEDRKIHYKKIEKYDLLYVEKEEYCETGIIRHT